MLMNNKNPNLGKTGKFIARKFLKHDSRDIVNFNQDVIIDSLEKHMDQIQKTERWGFAIFLILIWSTISSNSKFVNIIGLEIPIEHVSNFAYAFFIFVNFSLTIWFIRIGKLVLLLDDRENFRKGLSKLSTHTLIFNPFAFLGSKNYSQIWADIKIKIWFILLILLSLLAIFTGEQRHILLSFSGLIMLLGILIIQEILDILSSKLNKKNKNVLNKC
jgi:hypothetical protein